LACGPTARDVAGADARHGRTQSPARVRPGKGMTAGPHLAAAAGGGRRHGPAVGPRWLRHASWTRSKKKERGEEKEIVFPFFKGGQTNEFKH
jgi:hypothetical protein